MIDTHARRELRRSVSVLAAMAVLLISANTSADGEIVKYRANLYGSADPTTSAEVANFLQDRMSSGVGNVVVYYNAHGWGDNRHGIPKGSPWTSGVGTCPSVELTAQLKQYKPTYRDMQARFNASAASSPQLRKQKDEQMVKEIVELVGADQKLVVLGWCYSRHYLEYLDKTYNLFKKIQARANQ